MAATSDSDVAGAGLVGHGWVLDALARSIREGRLAHAYLLTGPAQVGKFATALEMARLLLCPEPGAAADGAGSRACGTCRHCRLAARRVHPDLQVLEIPAGRRNIPLQDVHQFMRGMALRPSEATRKVYIVRDAEDLAEEGGNALLKTIEEPPAGVVIILTAPDPGSLLPTIVSRCQVIRLRPVPPDAIAAHLIEAGKLEPARAEAIARASRGLPGRALLAAAHPDVLDERLQRASDLLRLVRSGRLDRIRYADGLAERWSGSADDVRDVLEVWMDVWRDALLQQQGLGDRLRYLDLADETRAAADRLGPDAVHAALEATLQTADALEHNAHPRLALETYLLLLPRLA